MDNEKKDMITKSMVLFGTQLRGYKKEDVNRYIYQQSEQHLKEIEELKEQIDSLTEKLVAQEQEQTRVNAMLAQSDQIIAEQRAKLKAQNAKLEEQEAALLQMQQDIESCEAQINELVKVTHAPKDNAPKRPAEAAAKAKKDSPKEKEPTEKNKQGNEDFSELTQALQNAKDKIFRFLKK